MTVSQVRELMTQRVVPENLLPQNIPASLMDEEAALPELDAFTFLNRLRSLGIGSADFLYLLKGCGAPEEAVEKIEQRPDMNLQTLIVTLDGSGLTPKDYTRMLYTARQLWERTITMRIDLAEAADEGEQEGNLPEKEPELEKPQMRTARQKKKKPEQEFHEYEGVKPIGRRNVPDDDEESDEPQTYTAVQKKKVYTAAQKAPADEEPEDAPDDNAEQPEKDDNRGRRGALVACAVGAAIVCAADVAVGFITPAAEQTAEITAHYAADSSEIFSELYDAYNGGKIGGENVQSLSLDGEVFGDLLVDSGEQLGTYYSGGALFTAERDLIAVSALSNDSVEQTAQISPPDGAQFLKVYCTDDGIIAVFSGEESCGLVGVDADGEDWLTEQAGKLTDIYCDDGEIRLGSVYTPVYSQSFSVEDELVYMPWTSKSGERTAFAAAETIVTGTAQGCGYAVYAEYSYDGEILSKTAVLGDAVYSGAETFTAALRTEDGALIVGMNGADELVSAQVPGITAAAAGSGVAAYTEASDGKTAVTLLDKNFDTLAAFTFDGSADSMRFCGDSLLIGCGGEITTAADVSSPESPEPLTLTAAVGVVNGDYALCGTTSAAGVSLTLYRIEDGKAVQADSYAKTLSAEELSSFSFGGANTFVVNGTECSGAAYSWFDGVSVVSEFAEMGKTRSVYTLYDDPDGYTAAVNANGELTLICGSRVSK